MNTDSYIWYKKEAQAWTQCLPIGNGTLGAMIYGGVEKEVLALNHDELWTGYPKDTADVDGTYEALCEARALAAQGRFLEAQEICETRFHGTWSQAYVPLGDMEIEFINNGRLGDYSRFLDLDNGAAGVVYKLGNVIFRREYIASYPDKVIAVKLTASKPVLNFKIKLKSKLKSSSFTEVDMLWLDGECPSENNVDDESDRQCYYDEPEKRGILYRAGVKVSSDGKVVCLKNSIKVSEASSATIIFACVTSFNGFDKSPFTDGKEYKKPCKEILESAPDYETIKNNHFKDYSELFGRVELKLGNGGNSDLPTDVRLKKYKSDKSDLSLVTLMFNYGRYLAFSSSRPGTQPSTLQGIWNDKLTPPWHSNYTVNINTEMNYWPVLMCRMPEVNEPLSRFMEELSVTGAKVAEKWYHAPGFVSHHNVDIWRMATPVPGCSTWSFWPGSSGWLCRHLF